MRELDTKTVLRSKIVCDLVDACKAEGIFASTRAGMPGVRKKPFFALSNAS